MSAKEHVSLESNILYTVWINITNNIYISRKHHHPFQDTIHCIRLFYYTTVDIHKQI